MFQQIREVDMFTQKNVLPNLRSKYKMLPRFNLPLINHKKTYHINN